MSHLIQNCTCVEEGGLMKCSILKCPINLCSILSQLQPTVWTKWFQGNDYYSRFCSLEHARWCLDQIKLSIMAPQECLMFVLIAQCIWRIYNYSFGYFLCYIHVVWEKFYIYHCCKTSPSKGYIQLYIGVCAINWY